MSIRPVGERVLIKPIKTEEKTSSGIILSGSSEKDMPNMGVIVAIGKIENFSEIKVGDKIVHSKFSGIEVKDDGDNYIILNLDDILAVVE